MHIRNSNVNTLFINEYIQKRALNKFNILNSAGFFLKIGTESDIYFFNSDVMMQIYITAHYKPYPGLFTVNLVLEFTCRSTKNVPL